MAQTEKPSSSSCHDDGSMTAQTESGSVSEDESTGWFGGITADFRALTCTLKETAGGVAQFVQQSAMTIAAEIALLEEEERAQMERFEQKESCESASLPLPWEVADDQIGNDLGEGRMVEDSFLKAKIMALSSDDDTFVGPFSGAEENEKPLFVLDELRISMIRRIISIDRRLAAAHARLSGHKDISETRFWKNYFHHCEQVRLEHIQPIAPPPPNENSFDDEASYVVPSPPASLKSVGSLVLVTSKDAETLLTNG